MSRTLLLAVLYKKFNPTDTPLSKSQPREKRRTSIIIIIIIQLSCSIEITSKLLLESNVLGGEIENQLDYLPSRELHHRRTVDQIITDQNRREQSVCCPTKNIAWHGRNDETIPFILIRPSSCDNPRWNHRSKNCYQRSRTHHLSPSRTNERILCSLDSSSASFPTSSITASIYYYYYNNNNRWNNVNNNNNYYYSRSTTKTTTTKCPRLDSARLVFPTNKHRSAMEEVLVVFYRHQRRRRRRSCHENIQNSTPTKKVKFFLQRGKGGTDRIRR